MTRKGCDNGMGIEQIGATSVDRGPADILMWMLTLLRSSQKLGRSCHQPRARSHKAPRRALEGRHASGSRPGPPNKPKSTVS